MDNMQDVSSQLMKPPKELASWKFPLTQILEEYFNLLPEPCKIHYGEAALIIQNTVNAYVRKVEDLYSETRCFNEKLDIESKEDDERNSKKERKSRKNLIDFAQFELLDFRKDIGKNINLKNHDRKSIKFLHHSFSQLENSHKKLPIEVFDVQGEIIGKKYDFRCNQQMTKYGTLVEEFTPKDFETIEICESDVCSSSVMPKSLSEINVTSEHLTLSPTNQCNEISKDNAEISKKNSSTPNIVVYDEHTESCQSFVEDSGCFSLNPIGSPQIDSVSPNALEQTVAESQEDNIDSDTDDNGCEDTCNSDFQNVNLYNNESEIEGRRNNESSVPVKENHKHTSSNIIENQDLRNSNTDVDVEILDKEFEVNNLAKNGQQNSCIIDIEDQEELNNDIENVLIQKETESRIKILEQSNTLCNIENRNQKRILEKESEIRQECEENESPNVGLCDNDKKRTISNINGAVEEGNSSNFLRRSKRHKQNTEEDNCTLNNPKSLKPIPFVDGIPEKLIKSRREFRMPCNIKLLKCNSNTKRKAGRPKSTISKSPCIAFNNSNNDQNMGENEINTIKMNMYSPSRPLPIVPKEEDEYGFRRSLDESFNINECFAVNYEPVTTLTMDLLGFHRNYEKDMSLVACSRKALLSESNASSPLCSPARTPSPVDFTTLSSMELVSPKKNEERKGKIRRKSGCDFEKLVKHKIKKIYEELDLQTDEDQKVARWHEELKPRLMEAERKPPFRIHEYESRIIQKLESSDRKFQFDDILREEPPCEVARYFTATLQLASTNNVNINTATDHNKSIEVILLD